MEPTYGMYKVAAEVEVAIKIFLWLLIFKWISQTCFPK